MKILVTGASGLLGLNLALMDMDSHTIVGVDRAKLAGTPFELIKADLLDPEVEHQLLDTVKPDAVIHTAALANLEACEEQPETARLLNAQLPGELADACARRGIRMLHISTDAVFDGTKDDVYTEQDAPNPQGVYASTKLEGERNVLAANSNAVVVRVNFFGWSLSGTRSLPEFFINNLSAGKTVQGFTDVFFCPLFVGDLAEILLKVLANGLNGIYHVVGSESLSKYDFGVAIAHRFRLDEGLIQPVSVEESTLKATRSHNLRLSVHKLSTALGEPIPGFSTGLDRFYTQYKQGYPQKLRSYQQVQ
jgi:dTDP-4-dehydrorhamnose reductase